MLDSALADQLRQHLTNIRTPIELVATLDDSETSTELSNLLEEIAGMSDDITLRTDGDDVRSPVFDIRRVDSDVRVTFGGIPLGHEFTSLVLALLHVGGHPPKIDDDLAEQIRNLDVDREFTTYFSLSCQNCPDVVQGLNIISVLNPGVRHVALDGAVFQDEVEARQVKSVPAVFEGDDLFETGRLTIEQILTRLDDGAAERAAAEIDAKDPFDVLVVGGGPAGASAAIYAARKGIRTGIVAERFGGQVLDTMGIENLISVPYTEGPKLAAALEAHVADYDVDVMDNQRASRIVPTETETANGSGFITVELDSGATLRSRTVILSTGARWRTMGVPGEDEYRNAGVTFCPHCDGPLFKNKKVAVIGGGNSGAEAAIDLAGVVDGVTVLEFQDTLLADDVLQRKMHSLDNVEVIRSAQTTEVSGDGSGVTGLTYIDRTDGTERQIDLEGVFVQIGLLPNTEWLDGTVELSDRGEIVIDDRGRTNVPGVFAAGDCTTVPYKQIVISLGAGSTAALSAFDHLIRSSSPAAEPELAAV